MNGKIPIMITMFCLTGLVLSACRSSSQSSSYAEAFAPAESAAASNEVSTQGTGLCANEFFPLRSDKTWKYTITSGDTTSDYSMTFKDITENSFTSVQTFPSLTNEVNWQCGENGILSSSFTNLSFDSQKGVSIDTLNVSGVTLPPAKDWAAGKIWDSTYNVQVTINSNGNQVQAQGVIDISNQIAAQESVTVPSGTYANAYRVDSTGEMTIDTMGTKSSTPLVYSTWYVKDVGMIKSSFDDTDLKYEMVLDSFE